MDYTTSEIEVRAPGRHIIRKKFPRVLDANIQEHKQLMQVPYNVSNRFLTPADVERIFALVDMKITIGDLAKYQTAFVHKSYLLETIQEIPEEDDEEDTEESHKSHLEKCVEILQKSKELDADFDWRTMMPLQERSGETNEFLGDAVCGLSVAAYLKSRYPDEDEGFLTRLRTRLVCGSKLGEFAEKLGLPCHMVISRYIERVNNGRSNYKILEDVFESFVGSMFEDTGYDFRVCHQFVTRVMEKYADIVDLIANDTNYKDQLLRYYQQSYAGAFPVYKELSVTNDADGKIYEMSVLSPDGTQVISTASARKKRVSEQYASRIALIKFGVIKDE